MDAVDAENLNETNDIDDDFVQYMSRVCNNINEMCINAENTRKSRVHWLKPDGQEAERLLALRRTRPLTGYETSLLLYHDGTSEIIGMSAPPSVCWRGLRKAVRARGIVVFWLRLTAERCYAEGGPGRLRDARDFEAEFAPPREAAICS